MKLSTAGVLVAPSVGPAIVTVLGVQIPILALMLSIAALLLSHFIGPPPPLRKLTRMQEAALTLLLLIFLFLAVTGEMPLIGGGEPMGVGMAVVLGCGLGFSGLLVIEVMGDRVLQATRAMFGVKHDD